MSDTQSPIESLHDERFPKDRLETVLERLSDHNLEERISVSLAQVTSIGGFSDIYTGYFKDEVLQEALASLFCLVCRNPKEVSATQAEVICNWCRGNWSSKLAIKQFRVHVRDRNHWKVIAREIYLLSKLSHPNILPFTGYIVRNNFPAIVTPWLEKGDLHSRILSKELSRSDETVLRLACGIGDGLAYLHSQDLLHCDLKSPNILLSSTETPVLADFGISQSLCNDSSVAFSLSSASPSTARWSAPELFDGALYSKTIDVWAFGMILYELLSHELPHFKQRLDIEIMKRVISGKHPDWPSEGGGPDGKVSEARRALRLLCERCWAMNPTDRPTIQAACVNLSSIRAAALQVNREFRTVDGYQTSMSIGGIAKVERNGDALVSASYPSSSSGLGESAFPITTYDGLRLINGDSDFDYDYCTPSTAMELSDIARPSMSVEIGTETNFRLKHYRTNPLYSNQVYAAAVQEPLKQLATSFILRAPPQNLQASHFPVITVVHAGNGATVLLQSHAPHA